MVWDLPIQFKHVGHEHWFFRMMVDPSTDLSMDRFGAWSQHGFFCCDLGVRSSLFASCESLGNWQDQVVEVQKSLFCWCRCREHQQTTVTTTRWVFEIDSWVATLLSCEFFWGRDQPPDATAAISWGPCLCMRVPTHFWTSRLGRRHTLAGSGLELRGVRAFWE